MQNEWNEPKCQLLQNEWDEESIFFNLPKLIINQSPLLIEVV